MKMNTLAAALAVVLLASAAIAQVPAAPTQVSAVAIGQRLRVDEAFTPKPVNVHIVARHADGTVFSDNWIHNLRTTGGADWQANAMGATSAQPAAANYMALTNDSAAAAAGDCAAGSTACTLPSEITTNGLARHIAAYSHSNGTNTWSLTYTWTASGTQSVQKAGMFNAASSGVMAFEANFTQVNLISTDTFTATWTVTY